MTHTAAQHFRVMKMLWVLSISVFVQGYNGKKGSFNSGLNRPDVSQVYLKF